MSKPSSRLSKFRSYSYYHVLVMCDSSNTADMLARSKNLDIWQHATSGTKAIDDRPGTRDLGKYSPKCVTDENGKCVGRYVVLIDGSTDAAFAITQVKVTSATAASAVKDDMNTSLAVEGSLTISEPKGVAFLDQVVRCGIALGVDNSQIVYALKTFFVGHSYDPIQSDTPASINDIPPVTFITYDVTGSFTEQGGQYEMMFVSVANGAARLPQYSNAVKAMNITTGETLEQTLTNLQTNIRDNYTRYYACVRKQLAELHTAEAQQLLDSLCEVTYTIEVDEPYKNNAAYRVTDIPAQQSDTAACDSSDKKLSFPRNTSIESAISEIMRRCPRVMADMSEGDASDNAKYEYKVHSCVKSTPLSGSDASPGKMAYEVRYNVKRYPKPSNIAYDSGFTTFSKDEDEIRSDPNFHKIRQNIIEFDYMYTGKNIDILEFDLKVNMGLAYLQSATLANTFKDQLERTPNVVQSLVGPSVDLNAKNRFVPGPPVQTPVFFGKQIAHPKLLNTRDANATIQGAYTLAKHASLEVAEAKVRIVGNDRMLATTNRSTSAESMIAGEPPVVASPRSETDADFKFWGYVPAYVKINIKMPRENDDFALFTGQTTADGTAVAASADYSRDFWFDGYYYVVGIEHVFENGEFTQILDMISIPKTSAFGSTKKTSNDTKPTTFDTRLTECYDSSTGCGKTPPSGSGKTTNQPAHVPSKPPSDGTKSSDGTKPMTKNDATSALLASPKLENVKGWNQASEPVKQAILRAAQRYSVPKEVLAQFCYQESKFDPSIVHPKSKATGLFQFLSNSWDSSVLGTDENLTKSVFDDKSKRLDPQLNAYAAARYYQINADIINSTDVGDLYLAHFLGAGGPTGKKGAWRIVKEDNENNGTKTLTEVFGEELAKSIANANKPYVTANMTVRQLREWAKSKMAETLIEPYVVTKPFTKAESASDTLVKPGAPTSNAIKSATKEAPVIAKDVIAAHQNCKVQEEDTKNSEKTSCPKKEETERRTKAAETAEGGQISNEMSTG